MRRALAVLLTGVALVGAGCLNLTHPGGASASGVLRVATTGLDTLDPVLARQPGARLVATQLFEGLVRYDPTTAAVMPGVATSWESSPDFRVFTFHLDPKARFSNGETVDAASFVRGMTRALTPALARSPASLSYELEGVEGAAALVSGTATSLAGVGAVNPRTLVIHLAAPDGEFLIRAADTPFSPLPVGLFSGTAPVGDGPFRLAGPWVAGQPVALVPNRAYHGVAPRLSQVVVSGFPDLNAAYAAWRAGQVDWTDLAPDQVAAAVVAYKNNVVRRSTAALDYLAVSGPTGTAVDLVAFREAISLAIDRRGIAAQVLAASVTPAVGLVPPSIPGAASRIVKPGPKGVGGLDATGPCTACRYDPARARQLLAQSGVSLSGTFALSYPPDIGAAAWMPAIARQLSANLGINAVAVAVPAPPVGSSVASPERGALGMARLMRFPTQGDLLSSLLGTGGDANTTGYANPAFDRLLVQAREEPTVLARADLYRQAERLALADLPAIPLFWPTSLSLARSNRWSGLGSDAFGMPQLQTAAPR